MASDESTQTIGRDNRQSTPSVTDRHHFTFLQLMVKLQASKQGIVTMTKKFKSIFPTFQEADESIILTHFKTDPIRTATKLFTCDNKAMINTTSNFPSSITALGK